MEPFNDAAPGLPMSIDERGPEGDRTLLRRWRRRLPFILVLAASALIIALGGHRYVSFTALVDHHAWIDDSVARHPLMSVTVFAAVYAAIVALSLPGAAAMTLTGGFLFGWPVGTTASALAATTGATLIFLLARTSLGDDLVRAAGPGAARLAERFRQHAFSYLLFLRLVPAFPFWMVNLVAAIAGMRLSAYVAATLLGILPGTLVFTVIGSGLGEPLADQAVALKDCRARGGTDCQVTLSPADFLTPELVGGFVALGALSLLPVLARRVRRLDAAKRPG